MFEGRDVRLERQMRLQDILDKLEGVQGKGGGEFQACCPAHEDNKASLSVKEADGKFLLYCHAGCDYKAIVDALGLDNDTDNKGFLPKLHDVLSGFEAVKNAKAFVRSKSHLIDRTQEKRQAKGKLDFQNPIAVYDYRDAEGNLIYQAVRLQVIGDPSDNKNFLQRKRRAGGSWVYKLGDTERVVYRLPEVINAESDLLLIAEGEKDVNNLFNHGFVATCNVGGAGKWRDEYAEALGERHIVIFQDNDKAGAEHSDQVAKSFVGLAKSIRIVTFEEMPPKSDVSDWLALGKSTEDLRQLIDSAVEFEISDSDLPLQVVPFVPFPVGSLPGPMMRFVNEAAEAIGCDPTYLALPMLSALGSAVGNSRRLFVKKSWVVPAIIWTAIIGESGTSKTPAFKLAMKPVRKRQAEMVKAYAEKKAEYDREKEDFDLEMLDWKKSHKKNRDLPRPEEPVPPIRERVETSDATIEGLVQILEQNPNGLLVERDELAGWFGSFDRYASKGQSDSSNWLSMFNAEPIIVDRKTTGFIHVESAYVCVTGGIQPGIMSRSLTDENKDSGIAARILMAYPPRKARSWTEADISKSTESEIDAVFSSLYELEPRIDEDGNRVPVVIGMSPAAKKVWIEFYNEHNLEQVETEGEIAAAYSKLEEYPLRFALLFHLIKKAIGESYESTVEAETVESGIAIANWFKGEAKRVYARFSESEELTYLIQLVEWINRKGGRVTAREVQQGRKEIKTADKSKEVLDKLENLKWGYWQGPESGKVGKPTRYFVTKAKTEGAVYGIQENTAKNGVKNNTVDCRPVDGLKNDCSEQGLDHSDSDGSILI
ncbi:DUF3987 domain-containing protein [bacterium]|nr:DUF3987 domain-containing protein [bacterium]